VESAQTTETEGLAITAANTAMTKSGTACGKAGTEFTMAVLNMSPVPWRAGKEATWALPGASLAG
jgi:hypothetical protein